MDEYEAIAFLTDVCQESRTDSIKSLHNILKNNKGKCAFSDCYEISNGLAVVLFDKEIDVKVLGLNFALDFISCLEEKDENCIQVLIPAILTCLQDSRSGVQLTALKTLKICLKKTKDFQSSLNKIISEGMESRIPKISKIVISKIHLIVGDYKKDSGLSPLIKALFTQLSNKSMQQFSFEALKKLKNMAGDKVFAGWCSDVEENSRKIFLHLSGDIKSSGSIDSLMKDISETKAKDIDFDLFNDSCDVPAEGSQLSQTVKFGFMPKEDYNMLAKCRNIYEKEEKIEKLKRSVQMSQFDGNQLPYFSDFIDFLLSLFDANNVRVNTICFEIIRILIDKFGRKLRLHLRFLLVTIFSHLCTSIPPLKDEAMKTVMKMFESIHLKDCCSYLFEFFRHSRSKQRQEALNTAMFALTTFRLDEFDMKQVIPEVLNLLLDQRRSVRQAAMECTALLGSLLGPDHFYLDHYLEKIESSMSGHGVTKAVRERLKIRKVPKCRSDGTVEYVAISKDVCPLVFEWILLASSQNDGLGRSFSTDGVMKHTSHLNGSCSFSAEQRDPFHNLHETSHMNRGNGPQLNERLTQSTSFGSPSRFDASLISHPSSARSILGRKYHSAGLVDRLQEGDASIESGMMRFNFDHLCNTPSSVGESISSVVSSATFPDTRKKFSAGKKVMRMFERLEQKEIETKRLLRDKVEDSRNIQSRRYPLKANTDHRMLLNLDIDTDVEPVENGTSSLEDGNWVDRPEEKYQDKNNNQSKSRSEYPLDLYLKEQKNRLDVTTSNNQNNSSNAQSRRISVVQIEMPDSWSNKAVEKDKDVPNSLKPNKMLKARQAAAKKKEMKENEEKLTDETIDKVPSVEDLIHVLSTDDWKSEVASLEKISEMCQRNPHLITSHLPGLVRAVVKEVSNLRSNVAVSALKCLSELFKTFQSSMETVLDISVVELLNRTGHTNNFIRQKALSCLFDVIQNVSFYKSLNILLSHGSNNKNVSIKNATSQLVLNICEMMGPQGVLCTKQKELTGKIIVAASQFLTDSSPEVRANGRKIFMGLKHHEQFEHILRQFVPQEIIARSVEPILRGMDMKGEFEITTPMSAHQRVSLNRNSSLKYSRFHSAGNLCGGGGDDKDIPSSSQISHIKSKKERHARMDETVLDNILKLIQDLDANDYRERWAGIDALQQIVIYEGKISAIATHINKIFDKFVSCLRDPNSKVTIHALQTLKELLPYLAPHMSYVINMTISTVAMNLASNNKEVREAAGSILDVITQVIDPSILMPSFVAATVNANARYKTEMVERVSDLVRQVSPQRHKIVSMHVLPLLWQLLSSMTTRGINSASQTKRATARLALELKDILGDGLISSAAMNSKVSSSMKQLLSDFLQGECDDTM